MQHWQQSSHPTTSGSTHTQRGYYPPHVLGFDPRWMMMPPFMEPCMPQVDYYPGAVHSSGEQSHKFTLQFKLDFFFLIKNLHCSGMMKPAMHRDRLNSPGSDEGSHTSLHQERRAASTEPLPIWSQDGYPLRSFTPPYQRQHESSDNGQPDDGSILQIHYFTFVITAYFLLVKTFTRLQIAAQCHGSFICFADL